MLSGFVFCFNLRLSFSILSGESVRRLHFCRKAFVQSSLRAAFSSSYRRMGIHGRRVRIVVDAEVENTMKRGMGVPFRSKKRTSFTESCFLRRRERGGSV
ncbi:hypothetical protein SLE2022_309520 [Rubroshorea leprosula]